MTLPLASLTVCASRLDPGCSPHALEIAQRLASPMEDVIRDLDPTIRRLDESGGFAAFHQVSEFPGQRQDAPVAVLRRWYGDRSCRPIYHFPPEPDHFLLSPSCRVKEPERIAQILRSGFHRTLELGLVVKHAAHIRLRQFPNQRHCYHLPPS